MRFLYRHNHYATLDVNDRAIFFAGIRVEFDLTQTPGNRVSSLLVRCADCRIPEYEPLVLTANYTIIMTNYLAEGGDNFTSFKDRVKQMEIYGS